MNNKYIYIIIISLLSFAIVSAFQYPKPSCIYAELLTFDDACENTKPVYIVRVIDLDHTPREFSFKERVKAETVYEYFLKRSVLYKEAK